MATAKTPSPTRPPVAKDKGPREKGSAPQGPQPKILRIGVIQAGKIIEERLIRRHDNVTIGASPRNTIVVPASTLPRTFTLFEIAATKYTLRFSESMDGRVSVGNQVLSLDQVRSQGHAQTRGNLFALPLTENSRGKVLLGEITLLFQFVTPPPVQPRPQLPPSVRGGFFTNMDWVLASSFISLAVINFGFLLYLRTLDFPRKIDPEVIPDRFAEFIPEVEQPKAVDMSKLANAGEKAAEKVEAPTKGDGGGARKAGKAKPCDQACQDKRAEARRARLAAQVSRMGVLKLLGTKGAGSGATANLIGSGDPGTDADKAFSGVGGLTVAGRGGAGGGGLRGKGSGGSGRAVGIGDLGGRVGGPGEVGTGGAVQEKVPKAIVKHDRADIDGTMNSDAVGRTIRLGMPCITACYQRALKRNPGMSGVVRVRISVNTMGKVTNVTIESDSLGDAQVTGCIKACAARLRFPPPEGGTAEIAVPFNFVKTD
jgi:TonB family protein